MSALFSIVIPVFNAAERLEQCLKSVLAQSFGGWQAVLVDDGSDDGSAQICDSFAILKTEEFRRPEMPELQLARASTSCF